MFCYLSLLRPEDPAENSNTFNTAEYCPCRRIPDVQENQFCAKKIPSLFPAVFVNQT